MIKQLAVKAIKRWWKRRQVLFETGALNHKPRPGRPKHEAFDTEEKIEKVVDYALSLSMGCHQSDVMEKFDIRSKKTLRKYTRDNEEVKLKRVECAEWCLKKNGRKRTHSMH